MAPKGGCKGGLIIKTSYVNGPCPSLLSHDRHCLRDAVSGNPERVRVPVHQHVVLAKDVHHRARHSRCSWSQLVTTGHSRSHLITSQSCTTPILTLRFEIIL